MSEIKIQRIEKLIHDFQMPYTRFNYLRDHNFGLFQNQKLLSSFIFRHFKISFSGYDLVISPQNSRLKCLFIYLFIGLSAHNFPC